MPISISLYLSGMASRDLEREMVARAIKRTDDAIIEHEEAIEALTAKLVRTGQCLAAMKTKQIARRRDAAWRCLMLMIYAAICIAFGFSLAIVLTSG